MQTFVLSIGLNVTRADGAASESSLQLRDSLERVIRAFGPPLAVSMTRGEWEGVPERSLQVAVVDTLDHLKAKLPVLAAALRQDAIAAVCLGGGLWDLFYADGRREYGGTLAEFPIVLDLAPRQEGVNTVGGTDTKGHGSVQAWSHGDLFPAVISTVEGYSADGTLRYTACDMLLDGKTERFATWDDAEAAAHYLLAHPAMRATWRVGQKQRS